MFFLTYFPTFCINRNLAKAKRGHNDVRHSTQIVDILYHVRQVTARVPKLVLLVGAFGTHILGKWDVVRGQRWYHSKERWWFL